MTQSLLGGYTAYAAPTEIQNHALSSARLGNVGTSISISISLSYSLSFSWSFSWT